MEEYITPIIKSSYEINDNNIYIKRDDLLPFSFGGNKVRISGEFIEDMKKKGCNCMIGYGNARSNLSRALSNRCESEGIKCVIISPNDDDGRRVKTANSQIVSICDAEVITCDKRDVANTVEKIKKEYIQNGMKPYYIYGNKFGIGNEIIPVNAYKKVFDEILFQEKQYGVKFEYIFLASGTGMTQSGLICGNIISGQNRTIVGISIARTKENEIDILHKNVKLYLESLDCNIDDELIYQNIYFDDSCLLGGYGKYSEEIEKIIKLEIKNDGLPLDQTYTGKGFLGMIEYLKNKKIINKNVLFIHTGGQPLFFDNLGVL